MTTCAEIMTPEPKCHEPNETVDVVANTMKENDIGPIPIIDSSDSKRLVGIVTDRDLAMRVVAEDKDAKTTKVKDVMTTDPMCCRPQDSIEKAMEMMEKSQIRRIPIVDDNQCLVGIISQADIATRLHDPNQTAEVVEEISKH